MLKNWGFSVKMLDFAGTFCRNETDQDCCNTKRTPSFRFYDLFLCMCEC